MSLADIQTKNNELMQLISSNNFQKITDSKLTKQLKVMIFSVPNLPAQSLQFISQARTFAENNLFYSLAVGQTKDIELAIDNVRFFYENQFGLVQSGKHYQIKAIHLLSLLSAHKNEQFYTKVQNLLPNDLENGLIQYVLKLNEAVQQGNYRKVFELQNKSPLQYFKPFLDNIKDFVRDQMAKSAERAYTVLNIQQALKIFQIQDRKKLEKFIKKYTDDIDQPTVKWSFKDDKILFERLNVQNVRFNSEDLIKKTLDYAEELEKIA